MEENHPDVWSDVSLPSLGGCTLVTLILSYFAHFGQRWVPILDSANLIFHEAGHPIFGMFFSSLTVYGGTLGQLVFPVLCSLYFFRHRQSVSYYTAALWFFENLWNISRYMADARAQVLPILGEGHDWFIIFSAWGILEKDIYWANFLRFLAGIGIFILWLWLVRQWKRGMDEK